MKKFIIITIIIVVAGILTIFYSHFLNKAPENTCRDINISNTLSLNKKFNARQYVRECNDSLTDLSPMTIVEIIDMVGKSEPKIVLTLSEIHKDDLSVSWENDDLLKVNYNGNIKDILGWQSIVEVVSVKFFYDSKEITYENLFGREFAEKYVNKPGEYEPWYNESNGYWVEFGGDYGATIWPTYFRSFKY